MRTLLPLLDQTRADVEAALHAGDLAAAHAALGADDAPDDVTWDLVFKVTEDPASLNAVSTLQSAFNARHPETPAHAFERTLLLRAFRRSLAALPDVPVAESVKRLICAQACHAITPPRTALHWYDARRNSFVGLCKLATLRRFPAGQLTWEVSGMERSWLLKARRRDVFDVWRHVAMKMGGLAPMFVPHLNLFRNDRGVLLEKETNRAYYRMAQSLPLQPRIRGLVARGWLHSPDTMAVSPHLVSFNRAFLDSGAVITTIGPADPDSGVFHRSPERRKAFEEGTFKPTEGLVLWARADMLAWAAAHPELADA